MTQTNSVTQPTTDEFADRVPWFVNELGTSWFPSLPHVHEKLNH
jgi:hypothetical protein